MNKEIAEALENESPQKQRFYHVFVAILPLVKKCDQVENKKRKAPFVN